jgi:hypothetical protein
MRTLSVALGLVLMAAACGGTSSDPDSPVGAPGPTRPLVLTDPATTPPLDLSRATVDLDLVVFDTFDGGSVRLSDADPELVSRLFDAIAPIDGPSYETGAQADDWLEPDDTVVGYVDPSGEAWAYPIRILNFHEIVNDELAGRPVLVSYCPLCASGVVYDRRVGGRVLSFSNTSALYQSDLVMVDRETGSYWWQVPGRAIAGELSGMVLTPLVAETTTWERWETKNTGSWVMSRPPGRDYSVDPFVGYADRVDQGATPFPVDEAALSDPRLSPGTGVIVVELVGGFRAWPVELSRTISEQIDGANIEIVTDGVGGLVRVEGEDVPVRTMLWFAAVAAYPEITLGG